MVLKTSTMKEPKLGLVTGLLVGPGPTSGWTGDIINNIINNFKIIKINIYILIFLTKNIQVKHIYKILKIMWV